MKVSRITNFPNYSIRSDGIVVRHYKSFDKILKPYMNGRYKNYCRVSLHNTKKRQDFLVHRLVAAHFLPNPRNKPQVNHRNGNTTDNRVENLEWCDNRENQIHAYKLNPIRSNMKPIRCVETGVIYPSAYHAARATGLHQSAIGTVARGKAMTTGGFHWEFCGVKEIVIKKEK